MEPRPFALETVVEVLGQDFTMMFESVQYVQSVKEKLNTTGVGALHGWDGDRGRLNYLDDEEDNGSLMSRASFGEDHGFHDNEYADPHTMVDFSYAASANVSSASPSAAAAAESSMSNSASNANNNDRSPQRPGVTFSDQEPRPRDNGNGNGNGGRLGSIAVEAGLNDTTLNMSRASLNIAVFSGGELGTEQPQPSRPEAGNDPLSNRRRSSLSVGHMAASDLQRLGLHSTANDGAEHIAGGDEHPM